MGNVGQLDKCCLGNSVQSHSERPCLRDPDLGHRRRRSPRTLTWYLSRKIGRVATAPNISSPSFLDYQQDTFDGVLCRWDYIRPPRASSYQIQSIRCLCQHCDFIIGTPNQHAQQCPSCSRRAVKSDNTPYRTGFLSGEDITGYQQRENPVRFQDFIRLEIDRRIRTGHWNNSGLSG